MSQPHNLTPAIKISNSQMIPANRKKRRTFLFTYLGETGEGFYLVNGINVSERDFEKMFPVTSLPIRKKGANKDTTKIE